MRLPASSRSLLHKAAPVSISRTAAIRRSSTFSYGSGYDSTIPNIQINKDTRLICQGFTGKTVSVNILVLEYECSRVSTVYVKGDWPASASINLALDK